MITNTIYSVHFFVIDGELSRETYRYVFDFLSGHKLDPYTQYGLLEY